MGRIQPRAGSSARQAGKSKELDRLPRRRVGPLLALLPVVACAGLLLVWPLLAEDDRLDPPPPPGVAQAWPSQPGVSGELPAPAPPGLDEDQALATAPEAGVQELEDGEAVARVERDGAPVGGLRVRAWLRGLEAGRPLAEGTSDALGRVLLRPRPAGPLTLLIDAGPLQVAAREGPIELGQLERLQGLVLGPRDEGLCAEVTLWVGGLPVARTRADLLGAFRLEWAPHPDAVLEAVVEGYLPARVPPGPEWTLLRLRPGESGWLTGRVVDGAGLPVEGALVRLLRGERAALLAGSDAAGRFAFPRLEAGAVTLEAHRPGESLPAARAAARVPAGEVQSVTLALETPAGLVVRLRGREGPLTGWTVSVVDPGVTRFGGYSESLAQPRAESDPAGEARFAGLPPGRYYVRAEGPARGPPLLGEVELRPEREAVLELAESARELRVRVSDPEGAPVEGVFLDVSMPGINWHGMPSARTGPDGLARFAGLPAGLAEVHLGKAGQWRMVRAEGDEASLTWTEPERLRLEGRVHGYEGEALVVCVLADVAHMTPTRVQAGGLLQVDLAPPAGPCQVFLLARDRRLAPLLLGARESAARPFEAGFAPGARLAGRLVDAASGLGVPGRVRLQGALAAALEAHTQWLGGTDHDEWITVNEWSRASGPEGTFELAGLPAGATSLALEALGAAGRTVQVEPLAGGEARELGDLPLTAR